MNRLIALSIAMDENYTLKDRLESLIAMFILSTLIHLPIILVIVNLGILFLRFVTLYAILGSLGVASWLAFWRVLYTVSLRKKSKPTTLPLEEVALSHALAYCVIIFAISLFVLNETLIQYF